MTRRSVPRPIGERVDRLYVGDRGEDRALLVEPAVEAVDEAWSTWRREVFLLRERIDGRIGQ